MGQEIGIRMGRGFWGHQLRKGTRAFVNGLSLGSTVEPCEAANNGPEGNRAGISKRGFQGWGVR